MNSTDTKISRSSLSGNILSPAMQAFLQRHVNFHRILWALIIVSFVIAWNRGLNLLYGLFSLLTALLLLSYFLPNRQLRKIRVSRRHHGDLTVGRPGSITYRLDTNGPRYHIELVERLEFADQEEQHHFFGKIAGHATCEIQFSCRQRGCFQLETIQLSSAYPFGVVKFSRTIPSGPVEILVFPRVVALSRLPVPQTAAASTFGDALIPKKGGKDEFATVREYVPGDALKNVHWPVSARQQQLVVKEYDDTQRPALLIALDCFGKFNVGNAPVSTFEFAVTIAASMIQRASKEGLQCFLVARNNRLQEINVQPHCGDLYGLYEMLARLQCESRQAYPPVVAHALRRFPQANLVATFQLASDRTDLELPAHVTHIALEMDDDSFRSPRQSKVDHRMRRTGNRLTYPVHANQCLETVFQ